MTTSGTDSSAALLVAVASASAALTRSGDLDGAVDEALATLGRATGARSITILRNVEGGSSSSHDEGFADWRPSASSQGDADLEPLTAAIEVEDQLWGELRLFPGEAGDRGQLAAALKILSGSLAGAIGVQRARTELESTEHGFRTIVERTGRMIYYIQEIDVDDPSASRTVSVTHVSQDLLGYADDEIRANPLLWRDNVHPDDRERVFAADAESNINRDPHFSMEYRMVARDGRVIWFLDEAALIESPGRPPRWHGILLDITDSKVAADRLRASLAAEQDASRKLRLMDETKNTFLQAVSHDLRTPLAAIYGLAVTLERGEVELSPEDSRDLAGRIASNARRLDRLVSNLLDMDRLARGIVEPDRETTDVADLIRRVVEQAGPFEPRSLVLDLDPVVASIDPAKVERIVENLIANATKHTPPSTTIQVRLRADRRLVRVEVDDDGDGIPPDQRELIFEPFQQRSDRSDRSPGIGVGLTLARNFAELHGGQAWVQDRDGGQGASFRITLLDDPSDAAPMEPASPTG
jgi:PAS domain S-box-containing protein